MEDGKESLDMLLLSSSSPPPPLLLLLLLLVDNAAFDTDSQRTEISPRGSVSAQVPRAAVLLLEFGQLLPHGAVELFETPFLPAPCLLARCSSSMDDDDESEVPPSLLPLLTLLLSSSSSGAGRCSSFCRMRSSSADSSSDESSSSKAAAYASGLPIVVAAQPTRRRSPMVRRTKLVVRTRDHAGGSPSSCSNLDRTENERAKRAKPQSTSVKKEVSRAFRYVIGCFLLISHFRTKVIHFTQ